MRVLTMVISPLVLLMSVASAAVHSSSVTGRSLSSDIFSPRAADSTPGPGTYIIRNKVAGPSNEKLVITSFGEGHTATVTPDSGDTSQHWILRGLGPQRIVPVQPTGLQAAWGANVVEVVSSANYYAWTIETSGNGYTIEDHSDGQAFWGLASATSGTQVSIGARTGDDKQIWFFEKIG